MVTVDCHLPLTEPPEQVPDYHRAAAKEQIALTGVVGEAPRSGARRRWNGRTGEPDGSPQTPIASANHPRLKFSSVRRVG